MAKEGINKETNHLNEPPFSISAVPEGEEYPANLEKEGRRGETKTHNPANRRREKHRETFGG